MYWNHQGMVRAAGSMVGAPRVVEVTVDGKVAVEPLDDEAPRDGDILLGTEGGMLWYARVVEAASKATTSFRETPTERVALASALVGWHSRNPRCEACHGETIPEEQGQRRRCTPCGAMLFFRTDPAVIVGITDAQDRLLLVRQRTWSEGRVSVIAGFVEPGESLEQACAREALEEVNLALRDIRYFGSQPWPFPRSLMVAFTAKVEDPEALMPDGVEITEARFLSREDLASRLANGRNSLPGPASIGRALIDTWLG